MALNSFLLPFILSVIILWLYLTKRQKNARIQKLSSQIQELTQEIKTKSETSDGEKNRILAILESMAEGVLVVDTEQKIIMANTTLLKSFQFKREEIIEKYFWEIFRDSDINELLGESLKSQSKSNRELDALLIDSVFQIQVSPIFREEEFVGVAAVFHDVTELKKLERARTEFVANASHELKTPLTSIMGYVETLKEGAIDDKVNRLEFLRIISNHSRNLSHLIEELLLLSKIESGQEVLKKERVDFEKVLRSALETHEKRIKEMKLNIQTDFPKLSGEFHGNSKFLELAFSNLIDNAIKYNQKQGSISVRLGQEQNFLIVEISDSGLGIPKDDLTRVFERFYRVDKSRARESGGAGLGLSIVKHIVEKHAGRVEVHSELKNGSCFKVFLPKSSFNLS